MRGMKVAARWTEFRQVQKAVEKFSTGKRPQKESFPANCWSVTASNLKLEARMPPGHCWDWIDEGLGAATSVNQVWSIVREAGTRNSSCRKLCHRNYWSYCDVFHHHPAPICLTASWSHQLEHKRQQHKKWYLWPIMTKGEEDTLRVVSIHTQT